MIGEKGIYDELNEVGIKCHGIEDNNVTDIASLGQLDPAITSVVVGLDTHVNYVKLSRGFLEIVRSREPSLDSWDIMVVGDRLDTDVALAREVGDRGL